MRYKKSMKKVMVFILILVLVNICIYNGSKLKMYREYSKRIVSAELSSFAMHCIDAKDERDYCRLSNNISNAMMELNRLQEGKHISDCEYKNNLYYLLRAINDKFTYDINQCEGVFNNEEISNLMRRLSNDFEDSEAIKEVWKAISI